MTGDPGISARHQEADISPLLVCMRLKVDDAAGPCLQAPEPAARFVVSSRARSKGLMAWALSLGVHGAAAALAAGLMFTQPAALPRGGDDIIPVELLVTGLEEALASEARPAETLAVMAAPDEPQSPESQPRETEPVAEPAPSQMAALPLEPVQQAVTPRTETERPKSRKAERTPKLKETRKLKRTARVAASSTSAPAAGETRTNRLASASGGSGGAAPSAGAADIASYRARVLAQLARHKTYPDTAREAGVVGRSVVSFTVTRSGGVASVSLAGSSGSGVLDQATLAMVRRAAPFPPMPDGGPSNITVTTGIRYDLR